MTLFSYTLAHNIFSFTRSALFSLFFPLWTFFVSILFSPLLFFPVILPLVASLWAIGMVVALWLFCGIKMEVRGKENLPANTSYIIASKHQSAWETVIFHLLCKKPTYVLKKELTKLPFFGLYLTRMKMICIDRNAGTGSLKILLKESNIALKESRTIVIFPEGTRTEPGKKIPYHPGIAAIYSQGHAPVVPVALNSGIHWGKNAFFKKPGTIVLEFLPPIFPGLKREEFMQRLEETIETATENLLHEQH